MNVQIGCARTEDVASIFALLEKSGLPQEGLSDHIRTTLVARSDEKIIGCVAIELYGSAALLRSVAVDKAWRGQGLGQQLTQAALDLAQEHKVKTVYLLTETANEFFARFGFRSISRSEVVPDVKRSVEFTTVCPERATVMGIEIISPQKGASRV
ncbi:GNAT family N-acetyltransferase [Candidatus Acetothermia bacterium]|nr:GNAT family N-acetyltransferase [Candidatus Acetothermia bacterium]MBI3659531.1 GNAT family N-acetyltransferase [Candidatus Acetothermia bacterium]